jgi:glycerophosphoryl diester phosphodiesterase
MLTVLTAFDLQGHRGARGLLPENTLPAFEKALQLGVTTLELDVGISRDGMVVICHDRALNPDITRDSSGQWLQQAVLVNSLSFAELQSFDVGRINPRSAYAARFPKQKPIDGTRMPALAQLFERINALHNDGVRFNIETKISPEHPNDTVSPEVFVQKLLEVIDKHRMVQRVTIQSFDWRTLSLVKQYSPSIRLSCLSAQQTWANNITPLSATAAHWTGEVSYEKYSNIPDMVSTLGAHIWSPYFAEVTPALVQKAKALGLQTIAWTVNERLHMQRLLGMGVDGFITDYPDRAKTFLQKYRSR